MLWVLAGVLVFGLVYASHAVAEDIEVAAQEPALYRGLTAQKWQQRYTREHRALSKHGEMVRSLRRQARGMARQLAVRGQGVEIMAIRLVFGNRASEAISVSGCETGGTFSIWSENGQYLGLFQMGSWERRTFGHATNALGQAQAAHRYFVASGSDWSPWECKP